MQEEKVLNRKTTTSSLSGEEAEKGTNAIPTLLVPLWHHLGPHGLGNRTAPFRICDSAWCLGVCLILSVRTSQAPISVLES